MFYSHPYLGKISNLTHIFQMDWNHQLEKWFWISAFIAFEFQFQPRRVFFFDAFFDGQVRTIPHPEGRVKMKRQGQPRDCICWPSLEVDWLVISDARLISVGKTACLGSPIFWAPDMNSYKYSRNFLMTGMSFGMDIFWGNAGISSVPRKGHP